jgi:copper chaperone
MTVSEEGGPGPEEATMQYTIAVENIKCGGCANSIRGKLIDQELAQAVDVDIETGEVHVSGNPEWRDQVAQALAKIGYPEVGSVEGIKAAAAKAKSVVSCAIGRIDNAINDKDTGT